ncbi:hypothetical protein F4604DRAFT_1978525 [Suillus subluteus]|nr:hypothetical protein F4604DRAFT_1978525 [Suillus subluteus]
MSFQCPSCGKGGFKDHVTVACHTGQPRFGCSTWLQNLICLDDGLNNPVNMDDELNNHIESGSFGDWDEMFQASSNEDQVYEGATPTRDSEVIIDSYPNCAQSYGRGHTFLDLFNLDENSKHCVTNPYYPFSSQKDWQVGSWLLRSGLSMGKIDSFLSLEMIKTLPLSFHLAKELHGRAEMLPSGPHWMSQIVPTTHPMKSPVVLYWCDPLDCILGLLNHPAFHDQLDFTPLRVYTTAQWLCRVYSEWMTGDDAWNMQSALPRGAMLLGTILSSEKTNISTMTGDRIAHPLLVSLANIHMSTRLKSSSNAFVLTALLPVPKFIYKKKCMRGLAAREGIMLSDPVGHSCYCFTPLASYIVDTLEAMMLAAVGRKTSPVTMAMYKQFGDPFHHEPSTRATTLSQLTQKFHLNGVNAPFWLDWPLSDPSHFLTPEFFHLIHHEFYDHDAKWLICAVGDTEIDFQFSVLQAITGLRHFHSGISKLKQVTGRTQCDIQHLIIAVSTDVVPRAVLTAVRALMDIWYLIQSPVIDDTLLTRISTALEEFHANKDVIMEGGFRHGQCGGVIENWYIPKLELMQSIVPSVRNTGVPLQWTADTMEHAHITEIKDPACSSNNNNYDPQICRHFDRTDKCCRFDLTMSLLDNMADSEQQGSDDDGNVDDDVDFDADNDHDIPADLLTIIKYPASGHSRPITNYFEIAKVLQHREVGTVPVPLCSFVVECTVFHLAYDPSIRNISVDDASIKFDLSDLRPAIADFLHCEATHGRDHIHTIGRARRAGPTASLPFDKLQVWFKLWLQDTNFHDVSIIRPAQSLNCAPLSDPWTSGQYDTVIIHNEARYLWPTDGLRGQDLVLSDNILAKWGNIRVSAELTRSRYKPVMRLGKAADTHAYLVMSEQPWRCFALILSFTDEYHHLRVLMYDHSGGAVSPRFDIYKQPDIFSHIIAAINFGSLECIGYDPTISASIVPSKMLLPDGDPDRVSSSDALESSDNCDESSSDSAHVSMEEHRGGSATHDSMDEEHFPPPPLPVQPSATCSAPLLSLTSQIPQAKMTESIYSVTPIPSQFPYSTQSPEPCGKIHVGQTFYTIKRILFAAWGLVGHGTVCYLVTFDDEDYIIKDHWVLGSDDQVVLNEIKMLELMDGVPGVPKLVDHWVVERSDVQQAAVEEHQILHWDCSLNNTMILDDLGGSEGFLIDWEFAVCIAADHKYPIGGTGTVPFMSRRLLNQVAALQEEANLGSQKKKRIRDANQLKTRNRPLILWRYQYHMLFKATRMTWSPFFLYSLGFASSSVVPTACLDLASCVAFKIGFFMDLMNEKRLIDEFHPYFKDLIPLATEWHRALVDNMIHPVSFNTILDILNSHLNKLPNDEEFLSTVNMLRNDAAVLTDRVKGKQIALESFSVVATAPKWQKSRHGDAKSDSAPGGDT